MAKIGMNSAIIAAVLEDEHDEDHAGEIVYDDPVVIEHSRRANVTYNWADGTLYGDDVLAEQYKILLSADIDFETTEDSPEDLDVEETWTGMVADIERAQEDDGEYTGVMDLNLEPKQAVGFGFVQAMLINGARVYRAVFFHKVYFHRVSEDSQTKEETITWGCPIFRGHAVPALLTNEEEETLEEQIRDFADFETLDEATEWLNDWVTGADSEDEDDDN